ncbi:hypothetical protein GJ496_007794 [Pomphorhynchus laevis]|nr:hypothetical protein GJ496_007794 [Pomphorhynchus laevis]
MTVKHLQDQVTSLKKIIDDMTKEKASLIKEIYNLKERVNLLDKPKFGKQLRSGTITGLCNKITINNNTDDTISKAINDLKEMNESKMEMCSSEGQDSKFSIKTGKHTNKKEKKNIFICQWNCASIKNLWNNANNMSNCDVMLLQEELGWVSSSLQR